MEVNLVAVLVTTVAMFVVGAVWYGVVFGKLWGQIHGFDKLSKKKQKEMQSQMTLPYVGQLIVTFATAWMLAYFMDQLPGLSIWTLAFWIWVGFMMPTQYGVLAFGGSPEGKATVKFLISAAGSLACVLVGVYVLSLF
jgi:hypothetical protein